jgi:glutamyl-Q tRNA(Asp) synthetase
VPASAYCGRFAPSPTGPLHFGSLIAALGSYLQAKHQGGRWLIRIEDLDNPRNQPCAMQSILRSLQRFGLTADGEILLQSARVGSYREALATLHARGLTFGCTCSRQEVGDSVYSGTCREGVPRGRQPRSIRVRVDADTVSFTDAVQGRYEQDLKRDVGDFVVLRADNIVAYHLAVVVDDALQGVTEVVRGADLLDSTPRQIYLQHLLGLTTPRYMHLPMAVGADGRKLSKQNDAPPIDESNPAGTLWQALRFLGQEPEEALRRASVGRILDWAVVHWSLAKVPRLRAIPICESEITARNA